MSSVSATLEIAEVRAVHDAHDPAALYQTWFRQVHRWIRALAGPGVDAEDLAQEVFIVVLRKLGGFDGARPGAWLYRIAQFTVRAHRRRAFRNLFFRERDVALDDFASPVDGSDACFERKQAEQRLYYLVNQLNPKWRDSFVLFEIVGLSSVEIARLTGIVPTTLRSHLFRARKQLHELVAVQRLQQ